MRNSKNTGPATHKIFIVYFLLMDIVCWEVFDYLYNLKSFVFQVLAT